MVLDLKNVFQNEGEHLEQSYQLNMQDIKVFGANPFVTPVKVDARAENRAGLVTLVINTSFDYSRPCDRCGSDTAKHMEYTFKHMLVVSLSGDQNDDYIEIPDYSLNLDELTSSDILLEIPSKYLCKNDCKGICPKCGANLNATSCSCDNRQIDPRLEALRQLLD